MKFYQITLQNFATNKQQATPTTAANRLELLKTLAWYTRYFRDELRKVDFLTINI